MLKAVSISNIAVIKELSVDFDKGFTVITGETGAGKSVLIDSISLVLGSRADKDMIRTGECRAEVTAIFDSLGDKSADLEKLGFSPDENGELCLYRYITDDGKSGAKINGRTVPISSLRLAALNLVAIHGQQDSGALSDKGSLISLLDGYIGMDKELSEYRAVYGELCARESKLSALRESVKDKTMMLDILEYQLKEIDSAKLSDPDEEDKLIKMRNKLRSLEKVAKNVSIVNRALMENEKGITASYMIDKASAAIRQLSEVLPSAEDMASKLDDMRYQLVEISDTVADLISDDDLADPEKKLDSVEKRLTVLKRLRGKYGESIPDIIRKRDEIKLHISELRNSDDAIEDLENEIASLRDAAEEKASVLSEMRRKNADVLTRQISSVLSELDMPKVRFLISIVKRTSSGRTEFDGNGYDDVDFLVSANVGEELQPISKIASGGELSRIMLAMKRIIGDLDDIPCLIFDEIDAGISGATAGVVGEKLRAIAANRQVVCITHLPQIAALGDHHYRIVKSFDGDSTQTTVVPLSPSERVEELARLLSGTTVTESARQQAKELLKR